MLRKLMGIREALVVKKQVELIKSLEYDIKEYTDKLYKLNTELRQLTIKLEELTVYKPVYGHNLAFKEDEFVLTSEPVQIEGFQKFVVLAKENDEIRDILNKLVVHHYEKDRLEAFLEHTKNLCDYNKRMLFKRRDE